MGGKWAGGFEGKVAPACTPVDAHITTSSLKQTLNMPATCSHHIDSHIVHSFTPSFVTLSQALLPAFLNHTPTRPWAHPS